MGMTGTRLRHLSKADARAAIAADPESALAEIEHLRSLIAAVKDTASAWRWDDITKEPSDFYRGADKAARAIARELGTP